MIDAGALAAELHQARLTRSEIEPLTARVPHLDLETAYAVQEHGIEMRVAANETIVGGKLGFTSLAMQRAMGVDSPNYGWLTGAMLIQDRCVPLDGLIHPKVEPEIGFLLGSDLPRDCTSADVLEEAVPFALENGFDMLLLDGSGGGKGDIADHLLDLFDPRNLENALRGGSVAVLCGSVTVLCDSVTVLCDSVSSGARLKGKLFNHRRPQYIKGSGFSCRCAPVRDDTKTYNRYNSC